MDHEEPTGGVSRLGFGGSHLDAYFGAWAIHLDYGQRLAQHAMRLDVRAHVAKQEQLAQQRPMASGGKRFGDAWGETLLSDGTALITVRGTLMKFGSSMDESTGTIGVRRMVRRATADEGVKRAMLVIDSPGGTVAGTQELADDVADLAAKKPTATYVEDLMASAALWIGTQAGQVSASRTSLVGSIGTLMAVADYSKMAEKEGIEVHVITSDEAAGIKGAGVPGTKITERQLAEWRRMVNAIQQHFTAAVAAGRGMSLDNARKLADGRVHMAADAKSLGLIDHVESFDAAMDRLRATAAPRTRMMRMESNPLIKAADDYLFPVADSSAANDSQPNEETPAADAASESNTAPDAGAESESSMDPKNSTTPAAPAAASVAELKAACPDASSDFIVEQAEKGASVAQAKDAYIGFQSAQVRDRDEQLKARDASIAGLQAEVTKLKADNGELTNKLAAAEQAKATATTTAKAETPARPGVPATTSAAAEQHNPPPAAAGDIKTLAKQEWEANAGNCQADFVNEKAYVGYRVLSTKGIVKISNRRSS
jgi:signal peptide peptidase SppA